MLGYQLDLQAAAKAQGGASSRHVSHEETAARLEVMGHMGLTLNISWSDRKDDVAVQLEILRRREL